MQGTIEPRFAAPPLASFFGLMSCTLICGLLVFAALPAVGFVLNVLSFVLRCCFGEIEIRGAAPFVERAKRGRVGSARLLLLDAGNEASFYSALGVFLRLNVLHFDLRLVWLRCFA
jgi:hypothetical protein